MNNLICKTNHLSHVTYLSTSHWAHKLIELKQAQHQPQRILVKNEIEISRSRPLTTSM